jgi:hypothetical protein
MWLERTVLDLLECFAGSMSHHGGLFASAASRQFSFQPRPSGPSYSIEMEELPVTHTSHALDPSEVSANALNSRTGGRYCASGEENRSCCLEGIPVSTHVQPMIALDIKQLTMASADSIGPTKTGYRLYSGCKDGRVAEAMYDLKVIGWCGEAICTISFCASRTGASSFGPFGPMVYCHSWCLPKAPHSASHPLVDLTVIVTIIPGSTDLTGGGIQEGSLRGLRGDQPATRRGPRQYTAPSQVAAAHDTYCVSARVI